ncbi:hypothetical protein CerSpe_050590 [Prunus speciosa]
MTNHSCPQNGDHKEKKENMERRKEELQATIEKQDDRVNHLQTSAFNLANYYIVFQGVILGAVVNATTVLRCSDRWFLFSLSLIAGILNLVSLLVIGGNYKRSVMQRHHTKSAHIKLENDLGKLETSASDHGLKTTILSYWESTKIEASGHVTCQDPTTVEIKDELEQRQIRTRVVPVDNLHKQLRDFYFLLCMGLFVSFAVIVVVGCWTIPCKKALQCIRPVSSTEKCIRVCEGAKCMSMCTE